MFSYYLKIAFANLRRDYTLTFLMVVAIGLGIGSTMTMLTVVHVMSRDPLPQHSASLFHPHIDPLPINYIPHGGIDPNDSLTWRDASYLLTNGPNVKRAAMAGGRLLIAKASGSEPSYVDGHYVTSSFFSLFDVPLRAGTSWTTQDDSSRSHIVVISDSLKDKLFGSESAVGRMVRFGDSDFRVVGVSDSWDPEPLFYNDPYARTFGAADQFFIPLSTAIDLNLHSTSEFANWNGSGNSKNDSAGMSRMTDDQTSWIQFWVSLNDSAEVTDYKNFLSNYSLQQKTLGRFARDPDVKLYPLMDWLSHEHLVPGDVSLQSWLALAFFGVAMINVVALLMAKFLKRSGEVSLRRALGAKKFDVFVQLAIEAAVIGGLGGVLGLCVSQVGTWSIRSRPDDYAKLVHTDVAMLIATVLFAVLASVIAALLPAWRACKAAPAMQIKSL